MTFPSAPSAATWNRLALRAGNVFGTRTWAESWWRHYGGSGTPLILTDQEDDPEVVVPLVSSGRVLRQLRFIGAGPSDQLGPVCSPEHRDRAAAVLTERVLHEPRHRCDLLLLQDVPVSDGWDERVGGVEVRRTASPVLVLETDDWDEFLSGRSKNFREQVRRRSRAVERDFSAVFRTATAETVADDLQTLFRLHRMRWGPAAAFASGPERALHEDFAPAALAAGWLRLYILELDGTPAAALYNFRFGTTESHYQGGRDPRFDAHSVGFVLYNHAIRSAIEGGVAEFRMLRGDESYKSRFASRTDVLHTLAVAGTVRGRAAITGARLRRTA